MKIDIQYKKTCTISHSKLALVGLYANTLISTVDHLHFRTPGRIGYGTSSADHFSKQKELNGSRLRGADWCLTTERGISARQVDRVTCECVISLFKDVCCGPTRRLRSHRRLPCKEHTSLQHYTCHTHARERQRCVCDWVCLYFCWKLWERGNKKEKIERKGREWENHCVQVCVCVYRQTRVWYMSAWSFSRIFTSFWCCMTKQNWASLVWHYSQSKRALISPYCTSAGEIVRGCRRGEGKPSSI